MHLVWSECVMVLFQGKVNCCSWVFIGHCSDLVFQLYVLVTWQIDERYKILLLLLINITNPVCCVLQVQLCAKCIECTAINQSQFMVKLEKYVEKLI